MKDKIIIFFICSYIINITKIIKINNLNNEVTYQDDFDFSQYETKYKILAIFYPENYINNNEKENNNKFQLSTKMRGKINICRILIKKQVELAKNHGIFGFGIVYNLIKEQKFDEEIINLFLNNNMNNFPFFIIFNNKDFVQHNSSFLIQNKLLNENNFFFFVEKIRNYIISENYIKIKGKPILGIFNSSLSSQIRNYIKNDKSGKPNNFSICILSIPYGNKTLEFLKKKNSFFNFPSSIIANKNNIKLKYFYNLYDEYINTKSIKNFFIINGSHPEKFFLILKKYLNLTNPDKDIFIINAWNDYKNNLFLSPQKGFGFLYLNFLSKAIFNLEDDAEYNLKHLENISKIAVQVHLFYLDLIKDIINKTNNIPVKFDLYITIIYPEKYNQIKNYIKQFSKANFFEILIVKNKGRDILPFLIQIKTRYKFYKYLCHIHTKKSKHSPKTGKLWRNYLYNNLLGNIKIISSILFDFEKNKKLGFIFPETYYRIIKFFLLQPNKTKKWMEFLAYKLFPNCKLDGFLNFPAGNMFWSKTAAIYQIFSNDLNEYFPKESDQVENTIMHGIERIWLYLVKFNHFEYKIIFKSF